MAKLKGDLMRRDNAQTGTTSVEKIVQNPTLLVQSKRQGRKGNIYKLFVYLPPFLLDRLDAGGKLAGCVKTARSVCCSLIPQTAPTGNDATER